MGQVGDSAKQPNLIENRLPRLVYQLARRAEGLSLTLLDAGVVAAAWLLASLAGMRATHQATSGAYIVGFVAVATIVQLVGHRLAGMYGPVWHYASVNEAGRVALGVLGGAAAAVGALAVVANLAGVTYPYATAPPLAALLSLIVCGGIRFQARLFARQRATTDAPAVSRRRTVIVGAGSAGAALAHELSTTKAGADLKLIGFIDSRPVMVGRTVRGLRVLGSVEDLDDICLRHQVDRVVITTYTTKPEVRAALNRALGTNAQVKVLPPASERVNGPLVHNLRDLDVTDLLGRDAAPVDSEEIDEYLHGATVLITGAGGSIGSEIARQVAHYQPAKLLLLDRDETLLHDLMTGPLAQSDGHAVLADICDSVRMRRLFDEHHPDVVFHAAAQKHVPILEEFVAEAVQVNVLGTLSLALNAAESGCKRFVHISTDKAAAPCSVMGATKRAAEQVVFEVGRRFDLPFVAVRFGNVLGSRGSVVPTFLRQILEGGPVTVTSAEMTRYFMTIPEAVSLVLQSGAMAAEGRIYLLDMGEPVPILSMAHQMIRLAGLRPGQDIQVDIVGMRPGERLHERLHDDAEVVAPAGHPAISVLDPKATWEWDDLTKHLGSLQQAVARRDDLQVRCRLEDLLRAGGVDCSLQAP